MADAPDPCTQQCANASILAYIGQRHFFSQQKSSQQTAKFPQWLVKRVGFWHAARIVWLA
jgi:hypothetical protein